MDDESTKRYAVRVSCKMADFLETRAAESGQSVSAVIAFALMEWQEQKQALSNIPALLEVAKNQTVNGSLTHSVAEPDDRPLP